MDTTCKGTTDKLVETDTLARRFWYQFGMKASRNTYDTFPAPFIDRERLRDVEPAKTMRTRLVR